MNQPLYWSALVAAAVLGMAARVVVGGPLLRRRAVPIGRLDTVVAGLSLLALVFHCATMFFAPWTDALPGGRALGDPIRALGTASEWAYWVPAAVLLLALRRVWWPGLVLLGVSLVGVGITMFWPHPLTTHLSWLAAASLASVFVVSSLVKGGDETRASRRRTPAGVA